jgi:hypothetical protein
LNEDGKVCSNLSPDVKDHCLTTDDRIKIIGRIHSLLYWVGEFIPDEIEIDGKMILLRDTIFELISDPEPSPEKLGSAYALADRLDQEARRLEKRLRSGDISVENAHMILDEILGLMRAVDDLRHLKGEQADQERKLLMDKVNDERRWMAFVRLVE